MTLAPTSQIMKAWLTSPVDIAVTCPSREHLVEIKEWQMCVTHVYKVLGLEKDMLTKLIGKKNN